MISLASVMEQYREEFLKEYGHRLLFSQKKALRDIISCRTSVQAGKSGDSISRQSAQRPE